MKSLKNQSLNRIRIKIRLRDFIKRNLWQYVLIIAFIFFCAWLSSKYIEAMFFCISHVVIRNKFNKQYHCVHDNKAIATLGCLFVTCTVIFFGILYIMPINISLLSSIPLACVVCWIGCIVQDNIDMKLALRPNIYLMTDDDFKKLCVGKGLNEEDIMIAFKIFREHLIGEQLYNAIGYSKRQTIRIRKRIKNKLGI